MTTGISKKPLKAFAFIFSMSAIISCSSNNRTESGKISNAAWEKEAIPDSVVQFLITSAASDFHDHQPPTPIDFRNVRIGYFTSPDSGRTFVLCGEFLTKEDKAWVEFATIKTSGYEQHIGKTQYCQGATVVLTDESFSRELKDRLVE